jgi:hypothetical protein
VRYVLVATLFVLAMITYMDRVCLSAARDSVAHDLGFSFTVAAVLNLAATWCWLRMKPVESGAPV